MFCLNNRAEQNLGFLATAPFSEQGRFASGRDAVFLRYFSSKSLHSNMWLIHENCVFKMSLTIQALDFVLR